MLCAEGLVQRLVEVVHADHAEHRHEHLDLDKRMIAVDIGDDKHGIAAELHAALAEDVRCIMADKLAVDDILAVLLDEHGADDLVDILTVDAVSAALLHRVHQRVRNGVDHEDFLLGNAQDVVVEARAVDDVLRGLRNIGGLIDDNRGVARAGGNALLAGLHSHADNGLAAGDGQHLDGLVGHDDLRGVERRLLGSGHQAVRAARLHDRLIEQLHGLLRGALCCRMGVVHHGVARGDHADGVVDDGGGGVRGRGDGADDAIGSRLNECQAIVTAERRGMQILNTGGLVRGEEVLRDLVRHLAVAGLLMRQNGKLFGMLPGADAHGLDQLAALLERHVHELMLGTDSRVDRVMHIVEQALHAGRGKRARLKAAACLRGNLLDLFFRQCHNISSTF